MPEWFKKLINVDHLKTRHHIKHLLRDLAAVTPLTPQRVVLRFKLDDFIVTSPQDVIELTEIVFDEESFQRKIKRFLGDVKTAQFPEVRDLYLKFFEAKLFGYLTGSQDLAETLFKNLPNHGFILAFGDGELSMGPILKELSPRLNWILWETSRAAIRIFKEKEERLAIDAAKSYVFDPNLVEVPIKADLFGVYLNQFFSTLHRKKSKSMASAFYKQMTEGSVCLVLEPNLALTEPELKKILIELFSEAITKGSKITALELTIMTAYLREKILEASAHAISIEEGIDHLKEIGLQERQTVLLFHGLFKLVILERPSDLAKYENILIRD